MTPEEKHLWYDFLKKLPVAVKRQEIFDRYILDFYIPSKKIVIEVDGIQHTFPKEEKQDAERDKYLESRGCKVLRYKNTDVNNNFMSVCRDICKKTEIPIEKAFPLRGGEV